MNKRLPTNEEWQELIDNCTWEWDDQKKGMKVTGKNGNSIFLPADGFKRGTDSFDVGSYGEYWSSSLNTGYPSYAWYVGFASGNVLSYDGSRDFCLSVRLVSDIKEEGFIDLGLPSGILWAEKNVEGYYSYDDAMKLFEAEGIEANDSDLKGGSYNIPKGFEAKFKEWSYTIPKGFEAEIKDGKVIVKEKVSEDERIRKEINTLYSEIDTCISELLKARIDKDSEAEGKALFKMEGLMVGTLQDLSCIEDYLEKQKDASKAMEAVERIDKYIDEHVANAHDMKDSNPDKKYYRGWDDALGKMSGILQDVYSSEKQKERDKCPEYCVRSHCIGCPIYEKQKEQKPGEEKYDGNMDNECIKLCDILNFIPSIDTFESCCGHLKTRYSIWFFCNDIITISRLGRCVERNYSDGKWELLVDSTDTHPTGVLWLRSKVPFESYNDMEKSVNGLCKCIQYWFNPEFDSYFNGKKEVIEHSEKYELQKEQKSIECDKEDDLIRFFNEKLVILDESKNVENTVQYISYKKVIDKLKSLHPQIKKELAKMLIDEYNKGYKDAEEYYTLYAT